MLLRGVVPIVEIKIKGSFSKLQSWLDRMNRRDYLSVMERAGALGVQALAGATPIDSGETAASWSYKIENNSESSSITWLNSHVNQGVNIAVILQHGHGTGTGGYVQGIDYINPAIQPIFTAMAESLWKEVTS